MIVGTFSSYLKAKWKHLKDCFTDITPADNNGHFASEQRDIEYRCLDCVLVFQGTNRTYQVEDDLTGKVFMSQVVFQCPCGSRSYVPANFTTATRLTPILRTYAEQ